MQGTDQRKINISGNDDVIGMWSDDPEWTS